MRVPFSWLEEHFEDTLDANAIAERLTLSGIEVEKVQAVGVRDPLVVVAQIESLEALPGAAGARRVSLQADRGRTLVSNAAGLERGQKVALALPGATLFGDDGLSLNEVEAATIYGQLSEGSLCAEGHLGISADFSRPLVLPAAAALAAPLASVLPPQREWAGGSVLWLAILPNIARCQSLRGSAREVAALCRKRLKPLAEPAPFSAGRALAPSISARDACLALTVTLIEDVRVGESPAWLKQRLILAGMTPINNVVDVTNYVMLEYGQPTHAYDADALPSLDLGVRHARAGDRLLTLQQADADEPLTVPAGVPLIVSADVPVAAAGVIGGRPTSITAGTRRILLESAAFELVAIRRAQQALKTFTEASARFSRGVNPELPVVAARRFLEVLQLTSPEARVVGYGEVAHDIPPQRKIALSLAQLNDSLGTSFTLEHAAATLQSGGLEVSVDTAGQRFDVVADNFRLDLTRPCDLIEEVARLEGYEALPETMPEDPIPEPQHSQSLLRREAVRDRLVRLGLQEIISYSLNGPALEAKLLAGQPGPAEPALVKVLNPVSVERSVLRSSLLPAMLATAAHNLRHQPLCRLFELGPVFSPAATPSQLPLEREELSLLLAGNAIEATLHDKKPRQVDFFELKALAEALFSGLHLEGISFEAAEGAVYRPGACARVLCGGVTLGYLGAVHPLVLREFELEEHPVFVASFELPALTDRMTWRKPYREYDRLPSIELDIALVVALEISAAKLLAVVEGAREPLIRNAEVFDVFRGEQFGADRKAMAIRIRLNAGDRTLEMPEALEVRSRVARRFEQELGATVRE